MDFRQFCFADLSRQLSRLSGPRRIAFAASCCERLLPQYQAFVSDENWGNPVALRSALDEIWQIASGKSTSDDQLSGLCKACEAAIPDTEDFNSRYTSAALDAALAILVTLECCLDRDAEKAATAGSYARDTVDMFIQMRDALDGGAAEVEERIRRDPIMIHELRKQQQDLSLLASRELSDAVVASILRESSKDRAGLALGQ